MTEQDLLEIEHRARTASPGPWYARLLDDDYAACLVTVSTEPDTGEQERWPDFHATTIVAATLVQSPLRYVDVADQQWDENADFIAHARTDIPRLLAELRRLILPALENPELTGSAPMTEQELVEIEKRADVSSPGPWYMHFLDDNQTADLVVVSNQPDTDDDDGWPDFDPHTIIAATLVQSPCRYVDIADEGWYLNAHFIAHARTDIPRLVAEIRRLKTSTT